MKTSKAFPSIIKIARYTFMDEVRQKSFVVMFVICAMAVLLIRGCYGGTYMVNGQNLDSATVAGALSKVTFHLIAVGVTIMAALLSMQLFRRERNQGMQACILSKAIARWQYVTGKILGLWLLSGLFMFILHGIVFALVSITMKVFMPGYLLASLLCSVNLLFVVIAVLLLSLLMPDVVAFLTLLGVGFIGVVADGFAAAGQSQMVQTMMSHSGSGAASELTWWKVVYLLWPKLLGVQQLAASLIGAEAFPGLASLYPLVNILLYSALLGGLLFRRFMAEDIV
jgi:ABC-type transport system involved in multi-copper enzyme maturation permease subunit